jgi:hypothetical protein
MRYSFLFFEEVDFSSTPQNCVATCVRLGKAHRRVMPCASPLLCVQHFRKAGENHKTLDKNS